jgi:hypothetical protein
MSLLTNPILAKLLAKENLEVRHGNFRTAWFDPKSRVLGLPIWQDHGKDVYDLLVGHEVGHALFTPAEGWHGDNEEIQGCPHGYLNVIEDVRIERKIRETYPGLISPMRRGYKVLVEKEFFGDLDSYDMDKMKLIDKINLKSKLSTEIEVPFNPEEQVLFDRALKAETWSEVVQIVKDILAYSKSLEEEKQELPQIASNEANEDTTEDESENTNSAPSVTNAPDEGDDEDDSESGGQGDDDKDEVSTDEESEEEEASASTTKDDDDVETAITDKIFRSREDELLDVDDEGYQPVFVQEIKKDIRDLCTIKYAQLVEERAKVRARAHNLFLQYELDNNLPGEFNVHYKAVKKAIIPAVKEFEMRKAAYQYQRSSSAKTGSIDVNQVHSYKFNEDIFKRVTLQADAKNHGMFLLVDYSGSMYDTIDNALDQVLHLVAFCKATNIPFEVYGFSSNTSTYDVPTQAGTQDLDNLSLFQITSSTLKKKEFEDSIYNIWLRRQCSGDKYSEMRLAGVYSADIYSHFEEFGSTPLHQALNVSYYLVKEMIRKNNIEKMSFVTLTDGDSNNLRVYQAMAEDNYIPTKAGRNSAKYSVVIDKKMVHCTGARNLSKSILEYMQRRLGVTTVGFFIADSGRYMHSRCWSANNDSKNRQVDYYDNKFGNDQYRKNRCVAFQDTLGYNEYYVLKKTGLATDEDEGFGSVEAGASKGKLNTEFKKFAKSKKTNRVLMTKFAKAVA